MWETGEQEEQCRCSLHLAVIALYVIWCEWLLLPVCLIQMQPSYRMPGNTCLSTALLKLSDFSSEAKLLSLLSLRPLEKASRNPPPQETSSQAPKVITLIRLYFVVERTSTLF